MTRVAGVADREEEISDRRVFQHVPRSPRFLAALGDFFVIVNAEQQYADVRVLLRQVARGIQGTHAGEGEIQQNYIRPEEEREMSRFLIIFGFRDKFKVRLPSQDDLDPLSVDCMIVTDQDGGGIHWPATTPVPEILSPIR